MAKLRPFAAYRPAPALADRIAALPYDVYNRQEALEVVKAEPYSFLAIDRAETQFEPDHDMYAEDVYQKAHDMIREQIAEGRFVHESTPAYYLYVLTWKGRSQTGIVSCASIDDYLNNVIKKHENTRADKELDRINHVDKTNFQTGPIFLACRHNDTLKSICDEVKKTVPVYDFVTEDGVGHTIYVIDDASTVGAIQSAFEKIDAIYIADGHHRCASAVKVGLKRREENPGYTGDEEFNYFLSVTFLSDELKIMDYNRVVKDLNGLSVDEFLEKVSKDFAVTKEGTKGAPFAPAAKGEYGLFLDGQWYKLVAKKDVYTGDSVADLDVSILQDRLLKPILGIDDPKTDKRIDFVGGIRGLGELEKRCDNDCRLAFSMYPTSIDELFDVADAGRLMPPKSTWFEPKLRSGFFLHELA